MAGRVTVNAGASPVVLTGLDATNATAAYNDQALADRVHLPLTIPGGGARVLYTADSASITPTVTDPAGNVLSAVAAPCRPGQPVRLGPFAGAYMQVTERPPTPQRYWQAGDPDWTAAFGRMFADGKTSAYVPPNAMPYGISAALTMPLSMSMTMDPGATVQATATIAGPMLTVGDLVSKWTEKALLGGVWDCNNKAATAVKVGYHLNVEVGQFTVLNPTSHSLIVGDSGTPGPSNEARIHDVKTDRDYAGAVPSGSAGLWLPYTYDSHIERMMVTGADICFLNDGTSSNNKFSDCHGWGWTNRLPSVIFDDHGYNCDYLSCMADSPSQYGFRMRGYGWRITAGSVFNGDLGNDNTITGVYADQSSPTAVIQGMSFVGTAAKRMAVDCNLAPSAYFTAVGCWQQNVVTSNISSTEVLRSVQSAGYLQPNAQSGGVHIYSGNGNPNTFVTGVAGDAYFNKSGGAGAWLYRSTGGTAWTAVS